MNNDNKTNNMALWDSISTTDVKQTKSAKVDGNNLTSISGQYMVMRATEAWGVVGVGWGSGSHDRSNEKVVGSK